MSTTEPEDIEFRSDVTVELVKASADDSDVVWAARVSTAGEQSLEARDQDAESSAGLIRYLMRDRHGCYDAETEVLTSRGWLRWPDVTGDEEFLTLSPEGRIEFQWAQRLIAKPYDGPMVRVRMAQVDLLVTPDHRMLAKRRRQAHREQYDLVPASDMLEASHRMRIGGGEWHDGYLPPLRPGVMALLGFFIGDGYIRNGNQPTFRLRKEREISYLRRRVAEAGFTLRQRGDTFTITVDSEFTLLAKKCYDESRAKVIPPEVLDHRPEQLRELLDGLWHSDGSVSATGKRTFSTTSHVLAGQIQEVAVKADMAALVYDHPFDRDPRHLGTKPRYRVTLYRSRNMEPKVGWTRDARQRQVTVEHYTGMVYCVTVPNGTLYVRRNGKPMWCGNSPFEHNSFTFLVSAPIFVFREFMRHRVGWSYNEESGRYRQLKPVFYVPGPERKLVQEGKPGQYVFVDGSPEQYKTVVEATQEACRQAYRAYLEMLESGVAREVARGVLPVATYSSMYATCNARSLMHFLGLRTKREDSAFPSFPQREIEMVAEKMEEHFARLMPITHDAFNRAGRVAP